MSLPAERHAGVGFRIIGIDVRIDVSWLVIALLIAWSLATGAFPQIYQGLPTSSYWAMAVLVVLGLALSILLHEIAHILAGRAFGLRADTITLFLFGGVSRIREEPRTPLAEGVMAAAGPAFSVVASLALGLAAGAARAAGWAEVAGALGYLATLNLILAVFNMVPAFPLDGGRVLRAALWRVTGQMERATLIATRISKWISLGLIALGLAGVFTGLGVGGLWWVLIGFFLRFAAQASEMDTVSRRLLARVPLGWVMSSGVEAAPAELTLEAFVQQYVYPSRRKVYPVVRDGAAVGAIEAEAILKTPRDDWPTTTVGAACTPLEKVATVASDATAADAWTRMREQETGYVFVLEDGAISGQVTLEDLMKLVDFELKFHPKSAG